MLHIAASFGAEAEREFKKTIEIDRLIDNLRETEYQNVSATHETWDCMLPLAGLKAKKLCPSRTSRKTCCIIL